MAVLAADRQRGEEDSLGTVRTLSEPAVALLLDGIQEVLADDLCSGLGTLAFLLAKDFLQLVAVPVGVGLLRLRIALVRVDVLLGRFTSVQSQIMTVFATVALIAASRLEEGTDHRLRVLTESQLR